LFIFPILLLLSELIYAISTNYKNETESPKNTKTFKILNHNLLFISEPSYAYLDSILEQKPDVLALQEVGIKWEEILTHKLKEDYPYQIVYPRKDAYGFALLSKYPILEARYFEEYKGIPFCQKVVLKLLKNKKIALYNTHLDSPAIAIYGKGKFWKLLLDNETRRWKQTKNIIADSKNETNQLFVGDLNTVRVEPLYQEFKTNWQSVNFIRNNSSLSFKPNDLPPILSLDHVFYKGNLQPMYSEVHNFGNSDHLPTISIFEY